MIQELEVSQKPFDLEVLDREIDFVCEQFLQNTLCRKLDEGAATVTDYQNLLRSLFYQVEMSSGSFALAAASCGLAQRSLRRYLIKHAEEEKAHSEWIENDLSATGYDSQHLQNSFPPAEVAAYISFNYECAKAPLKRLSIALMLETVSERFGGRYGRKVVQNLGLKPEHVTFLAGHSVSDVGHVTELREIISENASSDDWAGLAHSARVAGHLYIQIYEGAARS